MADKVAGLTALYATTMALFHRERTGEGQEVEVSMFETMASFMLVEHANGAMFSPPLGPAVYPRAVAPNRRPYETKDGQIAALIYNDKHWRGFVERVQPDWNTGEFDTLEQRARQIDTVYGLVAQTLKERTTAEWLGLFRELEIPAAPINTLDALFDDPHLNAVGLFETVDTPPHAGAFSRRAHLVLPDARTRSGTGARTRCRHRDGTGRTPGAASALGTCPPEILLARDPRGGAYRRTYVRVNCGSRYPVSFACDCVAERFAGPRGTVRATLPCRA